MSTRCQVAVIDKYTNPEKPILFYRHSDGYPEGVKDTLDEFCDLIKSGRIRNNDEQAAGWLIVLGVKEYSGISGINFQTLAPPENPSFSDWKVGAYEPCSVYHGDIEYFHVVHVEALKYFSFKVPFETDDKFFAEKISEVKAKFNPAEEKVDA